MARVVSVRDGAEATWRTAFLNVPLAGRFANRLEGVGIGTGSRGRGEGAGSLELEAKGLGHVWASTDVTASGAWGWQHWPVSAVMPVLSIVVGEAFVHVVLFT